MDKFSLVSGVAFAFMLMADFSSGCDKTVEREVWDHAEASICSVGKELK